ncbi:GIN domain-containing protein [Flavobacterium sp.]|uniref:GIN domain-containing protein n=1 Tax=Flavobacterium sp. TaxID=239 RepID=UPI00286D2238|nr:DUF2807 domain-containing protein [Flavobacterium sp.]
MKKTILVTLLILLTAIAFGQKKEKIKGSKTVTIERKKIADFDSIEIGSNLEVFLEKGEETEIKIEADDNLQGIISIDLKANTLRINTSKEAVNYKKLIVRITYTSDLKIVTANNDAIVNAIQEIQLEEITFKSFDNAKLNLNVNSKNFILNSNDKSKTELNLKSENTTIELSKNASLKALISSIDLKSDLYQKSSATIEGDITNAVIRLDNNADFIGNKLIIKNANITTEGYSNCKINVDTNITIDASGNSEIQLYGDQKIEMKNFTENATLKKKPTK